jgi:hypothetical protein
MANENTQENDKKLNEKGQSVGEGNLDANKLSSDDSDMAGATYSKNLMNDRAERQVRENEDASLQDDTYAFDSDNTGSEDYHVGDEADDEGDALSQ